MGAVIILWETMAIHVAVESLLTVVSLLTFSFILFLLILFNVVFGLTIFLLLGQDA